MTNLNHVIIYDSLQNKDIDPLFIRNQFNKINQLMMLIEDHQLLSIITPKTTNFVINEKEL